MDYNEFKKYDLSELLDDENYEDIFLEFVKNVWLGEGCNYKEYWPIEAVVDYICQDYDFAIKFLDNAGVLDDSFWKDFKEYVWDEHSDLIEDESEKEYDDDDYLSDEADFENDWRVEHQDY